MCVGDFAGNGETSVVVQARGVVVALNSMGVCHPALDARLQLVAARLALRAGDPAEARTWSNLAAKARDVRLKADAVLLREVASALLRTQLVPGLTRPRTFLGKQVDLTRARRLVALTRFFITASMIPGQPLEKFGYLSMAAQLGQR